MGIQRSDIHVAILAVSMVTSGAIIAAGLNRQAAASRGLAAAVDCSNQHLLNSAGQADFRAGCSFDADLRRIQSRAAAN